MARIYSMVISGGSVSSGVSQTIFQIKAGSTNTVEILSIDLAVTGTVTSSQCGIQLLRKSAAATVTSFTPAKASPNDSAAGSVGGTAATGIMATAEGTDGEIFRDTGFNLLNGYLWISQPEERIRAVASGILAIKLISTPAAMTIRGTVIFAEE